MMWVWIFFTVKVSCQHLLFTEFASPSCEVPPSAIRVIEDHETLDVSLPWIDMLHSIDSSFYIGQCGYALTSECCYSSTNAKATGNIASAFLVEISNLDDYTSFLPQAANGNKYLKINEINSTIFGNIFETYALCDGSCIDGAIRCYPNQTVNFYTDSNCNIVSESTNLGPEIFGYSGQLGTFNLQFQMIENAYFKQRFKTWINYDNWGIGSSPLGHGIFLAFNMLSILLTLILLFRNTKGIMEKRSFYAWGNVTFLSFWLIYMILFITAMYALDYDVYLMSNSLALIFFALSLYVSGFIAAKMFLQFAILPSLGNKQKTVVKFSVYFLLTSIHVLSCWAQYLHFIHSYALGDAMFENAYEAWFRYYEVWIYIIFIINGLISTMWVVILQSAQLAMTQRDSGQTRSSRTQAFKILITKDAGLLYIFLGQLFLLLSYGAISYSLIHIEFTMDFFANDTVYDSFYAVETLILTCHYALVDVCILRMKKVFRKTQTGKPKKSAEAPKNDKPVNLLVMGCEEDRNTVQLAETQSPPRTSWDRTITPGTNGTPIIERNER